MEEERDNKESGKTLKGILKNVPFIGVGERFI